MKNRITIGLICSLLTITATALAESWINHGFAVDTCYFADDMPKFHIRSFEGCQPDDAYAINGISHNPATCVVKYKASIAMTSDYISTYNVDAQFRRSGDRQEKRTVITSSTMKVDPDPTCHLKRWK